MAATIDSDGYKPYSLVKFANPILVTDKVDKGKEEKKRCKTAIDISVDRTNTREVLDCILPCKEWEENGETWRVQISSEPATRSDVIRLGEQLNQKLQQQQARETGICPVRRELFDQAFDEVVRQVTVRCSERGLLLLKVRDELRTTLAALQSLYKSSISFGMKKAIMGEEGKLALEEKIQAIKNEQLSMENELVTLKTSYDNVDRTSGAVKVEAERKHLQEMNSLQRKIALLKAQLETMIMPPKH